MIRLYYGQQNDFDKIVWLAIDIVESNHGLGEGHLSVHLSAGQVEDLVKARLTHVTWMYAFVRALVRVSLPSGIPRSIVGYLTNRDLKISCHCQWLHVPIFY